MDLFQEKLELLSKSEFYAKALQKPQLKLSKSTEMVIDYEFARLYKTYEGSITRLLCNRTSNAADASILDPLSNNIYDQQTTTMVAHYNDLIRKQDQQLNHYKQQEQNYSQESDRLKRRIVDLEQNLQEVKDQCSLLKISTRSGPGGNEELQKLCEQQYQEIQHLRNMIVIRFEY